MEEIIKAVHSKEVGELFKKLGISQELMSGKIFCCICNDVITESNFTSISKYNDKLYFSCNRENCYHIFMVKYLE